MKTAHKNNRGFTLIELLVVISIIGMLSSVVLVSLNSARVKARDAKRLSDIKSMAVALELYYSTNGTYPAMLAYLTPSANIAWTTTLATALQPYLPQVPTDYPSAGFLYSSTNGGQKYGLATGLDSPSNGSLLTGDGGYFGGYYELGAAPRDCAAVGKDWFVGASHNCP